MDFIIVYEYERFGQVGHSHEVGALLTYKNVEYRLSLYLILTTIQYAIET
jgi:tRNA(Glu) U13 pseudouridine synthase TruD